MTEISMLCNDASISYYDNIDVCQSEGLRAEISERGGFREGLRRGSSKGRSQEGQGDVILELFGF